MKIKFTVIYFLLAVSLFNCSNDKKSTSNSATPKVETKTSSSDCSYAAKKEGIKVNWTAFKTTKRIGVGGTFDDVKVETKLKSNSITHMMTGSTFLINTNSVNSNNVDRDAKLVKFFFGKLISTDISGLVKNATGDNEKGEGEVNLTMNGIAKDVLFTYKVEGDVVKLHTTINTDNWKGQAAIASINKACEAKHTGADGVSKTWNDVDVVVEIPFSKNCK